MPTGALSSFFINLSSNYNKIIINTVIFGLYAYGPGLFSNALDSNLVFDDKNGIFFIAILFFTIFVSIL